MSAPATAKLRRVPATAPLDDILAVYREDGGVIIEGLLTKDQVDRLNNEIATPLRQLAAGSTHDDPEMQEFHGVNTKRLTNLIVHSDTFAHEVMDLDLLYAIADAVFLEEVGSYWMTTASVIEIGPGSRAQGLHRDLENWFPMIQNGPAGFEGVINFLVALTEYTDENGATRVIPGSHTWPDFTDRGDPDQTVPAEMKPGDAAFISGKLVHGGGANRTADFYRRALSIGINASVFIPEEAYAFMVSVDRARELTQRAQAMIGFRSQWPKFSAGLWQVDYAEVADHIGL
ncbi:phytanoyl-CoA dioxygenase family protein [Nocardia sp. NPDC060220]|uniref:phytanoyl-CoA dioxygenase family protein n=1 Tax=Nocardia sp. NPDC060220 TaxID=3347076 RepID=UPI00365FAB28